MDQEVMKYLMDQVLILIPVLYVIGIILKSTPKVSDWLIPWILLIVGILLSCGLIGFNVNGIIQGILVAGLSVFVNQLIKQTKNKL